MSAKAAPPAARTPSSLAGSLLAIVLALLTVDFLTNSFLFGQASTSSVSHGAVSHLAENLVVARRVMAAAPPEERPAAARALSTARIQLGWRLRRPDGPESDPLDSLEDQVIAAQNSLRNAGLRLRRETRDDGGEISGSILLEDGSAIVFRAYNPISGTIDFRLLVVSTLPSVFLLLLAWWLVRRSFKPLNGLVTVATQVGTDEMVLLQEAGQNEVRQLIRSFNSMHERIHQLLTSGMQTLLAIGHDLRTPLARLQLRVEALDIGEDARDELVADISEMTQLLASLQAFVDYGSESTHVVPVDLAGMLRSQVEEARDRNLDARYTGPLRLEVLADPVGLRRAISNLIQNALQYGGQARVSLKSDAASATFEIADNGPGIPEERLGDVVRPFVRLNEARTRNTDGMGLGLAIVDRFVRANGGKLTLANGPGGGLVAAVEIPLGRSAVPASGARRAALR